MPLLMLLTVTASVLLLADPALAYVGPGAGLTMLGALWAVIAAVLLTIGGLLFWPIRAVLRRRRRHADAMKAEGHQAADGE